MYIIYLGGSYGIGDTSVGFADCELLAKILNREIYFDMYIFRNEIISIKPEYEFSTLINKLGQDKLKSLKTRLADFHSSDGPENYEKYVSSDEFINDVKSSDILIYKSNQCVSQFWYNKYFTKQEYLNNLQQAYYNFLYKYTNINPIVYHFIPKEFNVDDTIVFHIRYVHDIVMKAKTKENLKIMDKEKYNESIEFVKEHLISFKNHLDENKINKKILIICNLPNEIFQPVINQLFSKEELIEYSTHIDARHIQDTITKEELIKNIADLIILSKAKIAYISYMSNFSRCTTLAKQSYPKNILV